MGVIMNHLDLLVIGGDAAGMSAASQARRASSSISIGVFDRGEFVSFASCGIPYYISNEIHDYRELLAIDVESFIQKRNMLIRTGAEAVRADLTGKKIVISSNGTEETWTFSSLIIATGARSVVPPIPGIDDENIFFLRNLRDGINIKQFIDKNSPRRGIIIGGGFIGLEMAESLRKLSIETTILEKLDSVATTMSPDIRTLVTKKLVDNGVRLHTGTGISSISREGKNIIVHTDRGDMETDFIIASTGVRPNTEFLSGSTLDFHRTGAIIVNEKSFTGIPDVYAAGDCATVKHIVTGKDVFMPLGSTANKQGRVAGLQAAGVSSESFHGITGTQLVKIFNLEVGKTGLNTRDAETEGIPADSVSVTWHSRAGYYPGAEEMLVTLTVRRDSGLVIGGEIAGTDGAALRTNIIAASITGGIHVNDLAYMDLGYAPPFSPVWDPVAAAAQRLLKR